MKHFLRMNVFLHDVCSHKNESASVKNAVNLVSTH